MKESRRKKARQVYVVRGSGVKYVMVDGIVRLAMGRIPRGYYYSMLNDALTDATERGL
jgi:hypothetical protein